jgi:hypothetical protein
LSMYKSRGLASRFEEKVSSIFQEYDDTSVVHWKNANHCLQSYIQLQNYPQAGHLFLSRHKHVPMEESMQNLDDFYMLMKLRFSCNWMAHARYYEQSIDIPLLKPVQAYAGQCTSGNTSLKIYHQLTLLNEQWSKGLYQSLIDVFIKEYDKLEESDRLFILLNLINILHLRLKKGEQERRQDMLELYKTGVADGLFLEKMPLQEVTFLNICNIGNIDPEWTMQFIESHQHRLTQPTASAAIALGKANLAFGQKDFQKALLYCNEQLPNDIKYKLRLHSLSLRCLFEMQQENLRFTSTLVKRVTAFQKFLQRNKKLTNHQKAAYRNLARAILKIAYAKQNHWRAPESKESLQQWIEALSPITAQAWLLEKVQTNRQQDLRE